MLIVQINSKPVFLSKKNKAERPTGIHMLWWKNVKTVVHISRENLSSRVSLMQNLSSVGVWAGMQSGANASPLFTEEGQGRVLLLLPVFMCFKHKPTTIQSPRFGDIIQATWKVKRKKKLHYWTACGSFCSFAPFSLCNIGLTVMAIIGVFS